nr:zinc finger, CCHC-type [Tanacetum cinerariifolium]
HNAWIKGSKEIAGLMLMTMEPEIQQNLEPLHAYEMLKEQEEGQSVSSYVLKMKGYVDNLERLGHLVTLGLGVSLILIGLRKEYDGFVQNYNMHNMGKTVNELHAMLKLHEQTLPKSNAPDLHTIRAEELFLFPVYTIFMDNTIQVFRNNVVYFCAITKDGIFEIDLYNSFTNESYVYAVSNKRAKQDLDSPLLWHYRPGHISKKRIEKLQHDGLLDSFDLMTFEKCVSCMSGKMARKPYTHQVERAKDLLGLMHTDDRRIIALYTPPYTPQHNGVSKRRNRTLLDMVRSMMSQTTLPKSFWDYALETAARILNMVLTKKVEKTPYKNKVLVARNDEFLENSLIDQDASGSLEDLEIIQEEDTHPSLDTSLNQEEDDLEINEPQSDIIPIRRSTRTRHASDRMCLYIDAEKHELGDLSEPTNYKAALLDPESKKWLNAMNVEMESMKDNEVWVLVELPPNGKTIGIADVRAIRILIAIAAYYDYVIWKMDVKTAFLNRYLNEEKKLKLSKSQGASTPAEIKRMQNVPYASANLGDISWTAVKNILKYLRKTKDMFLVYEEAEYIAAFDASNEAVWVRKFISGLSVVLTFKEPISMYCDNTGAIAIANESEITKDDNLADPFTKALPFPKHSEHAKNIGMLPASSLM